MFCEHDVNVWYCPLSTYLFSNISTCYLLLFSVPSPSPLSFSPFVPLLHLSQVTGVKCGGHLVDSFLKELLPMAPIIYFKAVVVQETWEAHQVGYVKISIYNCLYGGLQIYTRSNLVLTHVFSLYYKPLFSLRYKRHDPTSYDCPLYVTTFRGPTYV